MTVVGVLTGGLDAVEGLTGALAVVGAFAGARTGVLETGTGIVNVSRCCAAVVPSM